jgi:exodeoxyribonuclease V alpha subunit
MLIELHGQLERITYYNEENHYTIAKVKAKGHSHLVTVVGNLISVTLGTELKLFGTWKYHPKYGEQFKISSYEIVVPATLNGIERYLGSGLIKGIGPVMAKRLVVMFGLQTLDIIETDIGRLKEVDGIGDKRIDMIRTAWAEQKEIRQVMVFLQGHDVSTAYAAKVYKRYGKESINIVKANPYRLADDIHGIGFLTADSIADRIGIPKDSELRAKAGILYVLKQLAEDGHVFYPYNPLLEECRKILGLEHKPIAQALAKIALEKRIIIEELNGAEITENNKAVYLTEFHIAETGIAQYLATLLALSKKPVELDHAKAIAWAQEELQIELAPQQKEAIREALDKKVLVITGGPGTGKTTLINTITRICRKCGQNVLLAAPTGRAAKKMSEATGYEAKTIHRLLEFSPKYRGFKKNDLNKLDADLIVIDEASMVDTHLMYYLLKAVPLHATVILVGDVDQLPSVGAGNVLKDMIDSGSIVIVMLHEIFRQARESSIIVNAHKVNRGELPAVSSDRKNLQDFYFVQMDDPEKAVELIVHMCKNRIPERFGFDPIEDIQVLTPMHRGIAGAVNLNAELQKELNPSIHQLTRGSITIKTGDKVMQIANNYDKDVYNGDIGKIISINTEDQEVTVSYDKRPVVYEYADLDEIVLAYAVTVHKSQGSEYPAVVMPLLTQHFMLLQRNLLYTAITRGKKLVVIIGTKKALAIAIKNNKPRMRYTRLQYRLRNAHNASSAKD